MTPTPPAPQPAQRGPKIFIATPAYQGQFSAPYVRSFYLLLSEGQRWGARFAFSEINYSDIVVSRNFLISNFYYNKPDCDFLLFVDADMGFPPALILEMITLGEDLCGVLYQRRQLNLETLQQGGDLEHRQAVAKACSFIGSAGAPHPRNPGFRETKSCGTGIMLISRRCVSTMIECCPEIVDHKRFHHMPFASKFKQFLTPFNKIELEDRELSEDLSFCYRWTKQCGGRLYANIHHPIAHMSSMELTTCYGDSL